MHYLIQALILEPLASIYPLLNLCPTVKVDSRIVIVKITHTYTAIFLHQRHHHHHNLHQRYITALAIIAASAGQQRKATHEHELDDETRYQYRHEFFTRFFQEQLQASQEDFKVGR